MSVAMTAVSILLYLSVPAGVLYLGHRIRIIRKVNPVIICYVVGIAVGNIGILPASFGAVQDQLSSVVVALSIPLPSIGPIRTFTRSVDRLDCR